MGGSSKPGIGRLSLAGASPPSELEGHLGDDSSTSLPTWLLKELERAGVGNPTIEGLDEETARDLIAEIRSDAID